MRSMETETIEGFERPIAVYAAQNAIDAEIIRSLLESEGIFAVVEGQELASSLANILQTATGFWGEVRVRPEDREQAMALIEAMQEGRLRVTEEDLDAAATRSYDPEV